VSVTLNRWRRILYVSKIIYPPFFLDTTINCGIWKTHPVQTAPSTAPSDSAVTGPVGIRYGSMSAPRLDKVANQITRSACDRRAWLILNCQSPNSYWYSRLILNKPRLLPLNHARLLLSQQWTSAIHQIYIDPPAAVVLIHSLPQNKIYISDI
jgi:hypothetical protein